jgi:hypothetical protein
MIDPNGSVNDCHAIFLILRRGICISDFSVPPRAANRFAASLSTRAFKPSRTSEVFSEMPVSLPASRSKSESMFSVVLICTKMHRICILVKRANTQFCSKGTITQWSISNRTYVTWPRAQPGRGAMWRSGAPQRRGARATPKGRRCTYVLLYAVAIIVSDERDHTAGLKIPGNEPPG